MQTEKTQDQLARELRVRIVREVAVPSAQADLLIQKAHGLNSEIDSSGEKRKEFLKTLLLECEECVENGTLASAVDAIEEKRKQYIIDAEAKNEKAKDDLKKIMSDIAVLEKTVEDALSQISKDVLAEKYGRGELLLTPKGLQRIIGRIASLNEPTEPAFGINLGNSGKCNATETEIAWMCENSNQHPPLFFVDMDLMPLSEEELANICWENDDYKFLVKNIPVDQIVWNSGTVFFLHKGLFQESYLIGRSNGCADVIRIEKLTYPNRKVEILGRAICNKENLIELLGWEGYHEAPIELEDVAHEHNATLSVMAWYLSEKYPGIILEMPQWRGEKVSFS